MRGTVRTDVRCVYIAGGSQWGISMADAEYHRKQAEILAGLALSTPDQKEAAGLSLLAAEHLVRAEQSVSGGPVRSRRRDGSGPAEGGES
jgi:hypothetical protein